MTDYLRTGTGITPFFMLLFKNLQERTLISCPSNLVYCFAILILGNTFHDYSDVFCCTHPKGYRESMHMYGSATLKKRKICKIFIVNNHILLRRYRSSGCPYSRQKCVPSTVSSRDLVYRPSTRLIHKNPLEQRFQTQTAHHFNTHIKI